MSSGNQDIDAVVERYTSGSMQSPTMRFGMPHLTPPGEDAPHVFETAFNYFNVKLYNNRKRLVPLKVNTGSLSFGDSVTPAHKQTLLSSDFIGFPNYNGGNQEEFDQLAVLMQMLPDHDPAPMPSGDDLELWRREMAGEYVPTPATEAEVEAAEPDFMDERDLAAEAVAEASLKWSWAKMAYVFVPPTESASTTNSNDWQEPVSEYEPEFEEIPNSAPVEAVSEPVVQFLTVVEPAREAAPQPATVVKTMSVMTPAPAMSDLAPQRLPGGAQMIDQNQGAGRDMAPQRLPVVAPAVKERPAVADTTAELLALGRQIAAHLSEATRPAPAVPAPTDATAEFLALGRRIVAHLDAAVAQRQQGQHAAEPLTVAYSSPHPKPATSARRRQSATAAKIAAIYAASPSPLAPPVDTSQPHLLALPRPMEQPMQPIFTGGQRRVVIPGRSNHGK